MKLTNVQIAHIVSLEKDGHTTAAAILADAKLPDSPLHVLYDWDVEKAAEAHWLARTRAIIRLVRYVVHTEKQTITLPRYVRDPEQPQRDQGYATLDRLREDPPVARRALLAELGRVVSALQRARVVAVGLGLADEIEELLSRVSGLQSVVNNGPVMMDQAGGEVRPSA